MIPRRNTNNYLSIFQRERKVMRRLLTQEGLSKKEILAITNSEATFVGGSTKFPFNVGDMIYNIKSPKIKLLIRKKPKIKINLNNGICQIGWSIDVVNFRNSSLKIATKVFRWQDLVNLRKFGES